MTPDNRLIAGYRRIKAFQLLGKDEIPHRVIADLEDYLALAERDENTCRLDFTPSEAVEAGKRIEPLERKMAKERESPGFNQYRVVTEKFSVTTGRALDKVSNAVGMSRPTYTKAKKVVEFTQQFPEFDYITKEMDETGKVDRAAKEMKRVIRLKERQSLKVNIPADSPIWYGDFREVGLKIPDNSVDLIFTDPPYNEDAIQLYRDLGIFAKRVLKPGGLCLAYSGQIFLPQVLNALGESLEYIWCFAIRHSSGYTRIFKFNGRNMWKPILLFAKPPYETWWKTVDDMVDGQMQKDNHEWQQALNEAEYYLKSLCPPNGLIVDPFCGSGTTLLAAKNLSLRYIGIEDDKEDVQEALKRLDSE